MGYTGESIVVRAGAGSFNGSENTFDIPITDLTLARNIIFQGNAWRKSPGSTPFDSNAISGTPTLLRAWDWHPDDSTQRIISFWDDGSVYREDAGDIDDSTAKTGLTATGPASFVEGGQEDAGA